MTNSLNLVELSHMTLPCSIIIPSLYLFCHFGNLVTQRFEDVGSQISQLAWYKLPLRSQKDYILILALTQKKVYINGFGNARCTREVFMKVNYTYIISTWEELNWWIPTYFQIMNKTWSYFMVLKSLSTPRLWLQDAEFPTILKTWILSKQLSQQL